MLNKRSSGMPKIPLKLTVLESRLTDLVSQAQLIHNCFTRVLVICVFLNIFEKLINRYGDKMRHKKTSNTILSVRH